MKNAFFKTILLSMTVFACSIASFALNSSSSDLVYIAEMTQHHEDGVAMAKFAEEKSQSNEVKSIGKKIIADQTGEIAQLQAWKKKWQNGKKVDAKMPKMDMSHLKTLQNKEFDRMFLKMMAEHHEGAISLSNDMLPKLKHQKIKTFAKKVIEKQKLEITQMKQVEKKLEYH